MTLTATSPVFGPPTLSQDAWTTALAKSPVAPESASLYALVVAAGMDPAVALGQFAAESSFGTAGYAATTHSWGNNIYAQWTAQFDGTPFVASNGRTYAMYPDWTHGLQAYLHLMGLYRTYGWATTVTSMAAMWINGSPTVTPNVVQYVNNIIATASSAAATAIYLPAFQTERDEPPPWDDCTRRSVGMLVDWMTRGQIVTNGEGIPATGGGTPGKGATDLATSAAWVKTTYGLDIGCLYAQPPTFTQLQHLDGGMVIQGSYGAVPAPYDRWDPTFTGGHAVFAYHDADGFFVMDPLGDPAQGYKGEVWPDAVVQAYAFGLSGSQSVLCAVPPQEGDVLTVVPGSTPGWYDAPLGATIYTTDGVTPLTKLSYYPPSTGIYSPFATSATQRAVQILHDNVNQLAVMNASDLTLRTAPAPSPSPSPSPAPTPGSVVTIWDVIPRPLMKFMQDWIEGGIAGVGLVNVGPYLDQITTGGTFHLNPAAALITVVGVGFFHGVVSAFRRDLPSLMAWLGSTYTTPPASGGTNA